MFEQIAGYEKIKKELLTIRDWILNGPKNADIRLPKGILFHGRPGNGKTLFLKEYSESFDARVFSIDGNEEKTCDEIRKTFLMTKAHPFAIVLIDEIDLLIGNRPDVERIIQSELDGIDSNHYLLVLATTNHISALDDALLRRGRFDRIFTIDKPDYQSRKELLSFYFQKLGISGDIDLEYLAHVMIDTSCADITAIANDVLLRHGKEVTTFDVEDSFSRIADNRFDELMMFDPSKTNIEVAYHEVGHSLMVYKNRQIFKLFKAYFLDDDRLGVTRFFPMDERYDATEILFQEIEIALGGYVMVKEVFHRLPSGTSSDLQGCRDDAVRLVNKLGYAGPQFVLPWFSPKSRMESEGAKRRNELAMEKLIHKTEKRVRKYLKKHRKEADKLAEIMMQKGFIDAADVESVMNPSRTKEAKPHFKSVGQISRSVSA